MMTRSGKAQNYSSWV